MGGTTTRCNSVNEAIVAFKNTAETCGGCKNASGPGESALSITTNCAKEALRLSGRGCSHCERRANLLQSQETCPENYRCPVCRADWIFLLLGVVLLDQAEIQNMTEAEFLEATENASALMVFCEF